MTLLEEHEIAPTYEIYFTGCSLRCRFCSVPEAIERPEEGEWTPPEALAEAISSPEVPPFRAISLVGGDPSVNWPYVLDLVPALRRRFPGKLLVFNTNLFFDPGRAAEIGRLFDVVVGDLHFYQPDCAARIGGARGYPAAAMAAAEALSGVGAALFLRILALPGHLDCCAEPSARWAHSLPGARVHLMPHYAPAGRARGDAALGRELSAEEKEQLSRLSRPESAPRAEPLPWDSPRQEGHSDPPAPLEIGLDGRIFLPFVTGELLPLAASLDPKLTPRLRYL